MLIQRIYSSIIHIWQRGHYVLLLPVFAGGIGLLVAGVYPAWLLAGFFAAIALISYQQLTRRVDNPFTAKQSVDNPFSDPGVFTYFPEGFSVATASGQCQVAWQDINALFGYKVDLYAVDRIQLDIFYQNSFLRLTEELAGWHPFLRRLAAQFPTSKPHWEIDIATPAFATNFTLLYEKAGLPLAAAQAFYYTS